jgi:hypothetical protein
MTYIISPYIYTPSDPSANLCNLLSGEQRELRGRRRPNQRLHLPGRGAACGAAAAALRDGLLWVHYHWVPGRIWMGFGWDFPVSWDFP